MFCPLPLGPHSSFEQHLIMHGSTNYAMLVEASGANRNVAINVIGDIVMKGAFINVESTFGSIGYTNDITLHGGV